MKRFFGRFEWYIFRVFLSLLGHISGFVVWGKELYVCVIYIIGVLEIRYSGVRDRYTLIGLSTYSGTYESNLLHKGLT